MTIPKYDISKDTFIGAWDIPENTSNGLLEYYNQYKDYSEPGKVSNSIQNTAEVNKSIKDSNDISISLEVNKDKRILDYVDKLNLLMGEYKKIYPEVNNLQTFSINNFYIQHYNKGGGFFKWHHERVNTNTQGRLFAFMTYLNTIDEGGTAFLYQNITIQARKNLTLIWPAEWTHTHKGIVSEKEEKIIATGWFEWKKKS